MAISAVSESSSSHSRHIQDAHQAIGNLRDVASLLREKIANHDGAIGIVNKERLLHLIQAVDELSAPDYRAVVGMLNYAKHHRTEVTVLQAIDKMINVVGVSPHLSQIGNWLRTLHEEASRRLNPLNSSASLSESAKLMGQAYTDGKFLDDARLLIRLAYIPGINMVNPKGQESLPSGLAAQGRITIRLTNDDKFGGITISHFEKKSLLTVEPDKIVTNRNAFKTLELKDGDSIFIGRDLRVSKLFGFRIDLQIPVACQINHLGLSRAGIMICKVGNEIQLYDRGSLNDISFITDMSVSGVYEPKSRFGDDGFSHGNTKYF